MRTLLSLAISGLLSVSAFAQNSNISIKSFNAIARGPQVLLSWNPEATGTTTYALEKSKNGSDFTAFGSVEGGQSNTEFLETDFKPYEGLSYYRLKITSSEGITTYSNIVPVKYNDAGEPVSPVEQTYYNTPSANDNTILVVVRNAAGDEYYSKVDVENKGNPVECNNPDPLLSSGTYTIVGCSDQEYYSKQMLVK